MEDQSTIVQHYAILIGINDYPDRPLQGCVQDVQDIREYLEQTINPLHVEMFIAPGQPDELTHFPTCKNITAAMLGVKFEAKAGDYVYIHFSGHGTRGCPDGEFSELSTGDLGLVLLKEEDMSKEDYFWGTRLGPLLNGMVRKGLVVTLVLDCCFAATVYRRDDGVRFFPYNAKFDSNFLRADTSPVGRPRLSAGPRAGRDASMRPNWLIDPDGYAILAGCGPNQEASEIKRDGRVHGALSYCLRRSFNGPGGCTRNHGTIYRRLLAAFHQHSVQQSPERFGNPDQGFFGQPNYQSHKHLIQILNKNKECFQLQAGQAHGFQDGDQFELYPPDFDFRYLSGEKPLKATILQAGPFSSDLKLSDKALILDLSGWNGIAVTQASLQTYPILLDSRLLNGEEWTKTLMKHSLAIETETSQATSFQILTNEQSQFEIRDEQGYEVKNIPHMTLNHSDINYAAEIVEHLVRFTLVKNLAKAIPQASFRENFNIRMSSSGKQSNPDDLINVKHGESLELLIQNLGNGQLYFTCLDLRPSWEITNLVKRSYWPIPPKEGDKGFLGESRKRIKMTVPTYMVEKGFQQCDDFIKIFVTSRPAQFDILEMPRLGEAVGRKYVSSKVDGHRGSNTLEEWDAFTFHIRVSL
jgi:hypothetical protein